MQRATAAPLLVQEGKSQPRSSRTQTIPCPDPMKDPANFSPTLQSVQQEKALSWFCCLDWLLLDVRWGRTLNDWREKRKQAFLAVSVVEDLILLSKFLPASASLSPLV